MGAFDRAESWLEGEPDTAVSVLLVIVCLVGLVVAFAGPRTLKLGVLAWMLLP